MKRNSTKPRCARPNMFFTHCLGEPKAGVWFPVCPAVMASDQFLHGLAVVQQVLRTAVVARNGRGGIYPKDVARRGPCQGLVRLWGAQPPRLRRSVPRRPDRVFGEGAEHCTRGARAPHANQIRWFTAARGPRSRNVNRARTRCLARLVPSRETLPCRRAGPENQSGRGRGL